MDFIERWLGISPDGGNGTLELLLVTAFVAGIIILAGRRKVIAFARHHIAQDRNFRNGD
jgi:hypothetical protein